MKRGLAARAAAIAKRDLAACVTADGIVAGRHHFVDLWARDSLFASLGAPPKVAKRTVETFFRFQRPDGAVPYRIFRRFGTLVPNFHSIQSGGFVPDGGLMVLLHARNKNAENFYRKKYKGCLISEWFQCEWADGVYKSGKTLWTNVLYWKATGSDSIKKKIRDTFWNGKYFSDWADYKRHDYFASHPNMLAVIFGLASDAESASILDFAGTHCFAEFTLRENYPSYPFWRIPVQQQAAGMRDYHNGLLWLQPGILYAIALYKTGRRHQAENFLEKIAQKIVAYNGVYEVYEQTGAPVRRFLYRAEQPFAWSAGLFLWACRVTQGNS